MLQDPPSPPRQRRHSCPPWDHLRKVLNTATAYRVLERAEVREGTWTSGGCGILAEAIHALLPDSRLWDLHDASGAQHVVVETPAGDFIDGDGVSARATLRRRWIQVEGLRPPLRLVPHDRAHCQAKGIPCAPADIARVRRFLARALRSGLLHE